MDLARVAGDVEGGGPHAGEHELQVGGFVQRRVGGRGAKQNADIMVGLGRKEDSRIGLAEKRVMALWQQEAARRWNVANDAGRLQGMAVHTSPRARSRRARLPVPKAETAEVNATKPTLPARSRAAFVEATLDDGVPRIIEERRHPITRRSSAGEAKILAGPRQGRGTCSSQIGERVEAGSRVGAVDVHATRRIGREPMVTGSSKEGLHGRTQGVTMCTGEGQRL